MVVRESCSFQPGEKRAETNNSERLPFQVCESIWPAIVSVSRFPKTSHTRQCERSIVLEEVAHFESCQGTESQR